MTRKLIIFGNGLGMAIDPQHFSLQNALNSVWNDNQLWSDLNHRGLISNCIPQGGCPNSEDDLDKLHLVATSCNFLQEFPAYNNTHWLSQDGVNFPLAAQQYIHTVATYLHNTSHQLPQHFIEPLTTFINNTKSHVATLNYDKLLYQAFIDANITSGGYSGTLVDGLLDQGFYESNLERRHGNSFGYYMHLHGSPLIYNYENVAYKYQRHELLLNELFPSNHIVLTHIRHKPSVIAASYVLSTYWRYLNFAISEVDEIILFGYSGLDNHLNNLLKINSLSKNFTVVEWSGSGIPGVRAVYWNQCLGKFPKIIHLDNITDFNEW